MPISLAAQWALQLRRANNTPTLIQVSISLGAAANATSLVVSAAATGFRIYLEKLELVPAASGRYALYDGADNTATNRLTGDIQANGGAQYVHTDIITSVDSNGTVGSLVLNRLDAIAVAGVLTYRLV